MLLIFLLLFILQAACSSIQFDFVEIWSYCLVGPPQPVGGRHGGRTKWKPYCVHMYSVPHTINNAIVSKEEGQQCDNQRHLASPQLVANVKLTSEPCWLTTGSSQFDNLFPPAATKNSSPFQTIVALPFRKEAYHGLLRTDMVLLLYAFGSHDRNESTLKFLEHIGIAAVASIAPSFPIEKRDEFMMPKLETPSRNSYGGVGMSIQLQNLDPFGSFELFDLPDECDVDLDMKFELLRDVEFFVNGTRCTMYQGRTEKHIDVVIKMVRKDAADKELVKSELLVEVNILRRVSTMIGGFVSVVEHYSDY